MARSRTAPPDKSIGTDARPQTCSRTALLMPCRRATRMASPPTTGQSLVPSGRHRALDESASRHRLDPASRPQLRYQQARPRPRNSTSYRCARGERIPTDLAREMPSPAPPSPPTACACAARETKSSVPAVLPVLLSLQAQYCNATVRSYPLCCIQPTHHSCTGTMGELA